MIITKHKPKISNTNRIAELDGLRGIAILMVLIWHYVICSQPPTPQTEIGKAITLIGSSFWSGVDLFFVLSGFLIATIILENYQKKNFLKVFWVKRSYRILPVLVLLVGTCYAIKPFCEAPSYNWLFANLMPWWSYLTFTQNFFMAYQVSTGGHFLGITWSLAIEEQFYITLPLLILICGKSKFSKIVTPLIIICVLLRLIWPGVHNHLIMPFRMDSLMAGCLIATLWNNGLAQKILIKNRKIVIYTLILTLIITYQLLIENRLGVFYYTWFAFLYSLLLTTALLFQNEAITSIFRMSSLRFLGAVSYGLYMYHQAINGLLHAYINGEAPSLQTQLGISLTILALGISILVAWLSHKYYESYFIKVGKLWNYNTENEIKDAKI